MRPRCCPHQRFSAGLHGLFLDRHLNQAGPCHEDRRALELRRRRPDSGITVGSSSADFHLKNSIFDRAPCGDVRRLYQPSRPSSLAGFLRSMRSMSASATPSFLIAAKAASMPSGCVMLELWPRSDETTMLLAPSSFAAC